jgi:peroxiredoxin
MSIWRTKGKVEVGSVAPDFTLSSQSEEMVSLGAFICKKPMDLFYPKDDTSSCTKEICSFRDTGLRVGG